MGRLQKELTGSMSLSILKDFGHKDVEDEGSMKVKYCGLGFTREGMCFRRNPKTLCLMASISGYARFTKAST